MIGPQGYRKRFLRSVMFGVFALASIAAAATPAEARRHSARVHRPALHFSSIVIDAETGKVLSADDADRRNYPASLTKMMTLYLTFEAIKEGKVSPDSPMTVSYHAARQVPSKLGLRPHQTVKLRDLILAVITHSANDAAVTIAENLAGSEPAFARLMNAKAHELGMNSTTFRNASGLPNPNQMTTARDIATLARALWRDFPKEYALFATEKFTYRNITYETHNHLMENFVGMDGIKTGYIHASGFNLAASAVRNGRRLIGVVMGGTSAASRDAQMAALLDDAFNGNSLGQLKTVSYRNDDSKATSTTPSDSAITALNPVGSAEAATTPDTDTLRHASFPHEVSHDWSIQVGAFTEPKAAERALSTALARLGVKGKRALVVPPGLGDKEPLYRARITGFTAAEADRACRIFHSRRSRHKQCAVIPPLLPAAFDQPASPPAPTPTAASASISVPAVAAAPADVPMPTSVSAAATEAMANALATTATPY
jgi:D-alanyl-D-alanine carboxypeptidase